MRGRGCTGAEPIKVIIADMPTWLADGVRKTIEMEKDMVILALVETLNGLADGLQEPDVIVTVATGGELAPPYCRALFRDRAVPVVAIGDEGSIHVFSRRRTRGHGLEGLIGLIRKAVADSQQASGF